MFSIIMSELKNFGVLSDAIAPQAQNYCYNYDSEHEKYLCEFISSRYCFPKCYVIELFAAFTLPEFSTSTPGSIRTRSARFTFSVETIWNPISITSIHRLIHRTKLWQKLIKDTRFSPSKPLPPT